MPAVGVGHLRTGSKSLPVLLRELPGEFDRIVDEAQQQGEIESLRIGHVVNADGNRFAHNRAEKRRSRHQPLMVAEQTGTSSVRSSACVPPGTCSVRPGGVVVRSVRGPRPSGARRSHHPAGSGVQVLQVMRPRERIPQPRLQQRTLARHR